MRAVDSLRAGRERVVVAISGFGGAGKTTLARRLREHYRVGERQVVSLDDFIVDRARGEGMLGGFRWERLRAVLADVRAGRRLRYTASDFEGRPRQRVDEELPAVVIVEGVRLLRPELAGFFDLAVWIDCPLELAAERGWMVPAYTLPPNAEHVSILRVLCKETLGQPLIETLHADVLNALGTLDEKGAVHELDRRRVKSNTGF